MIDNIITNAILPALAREVLNHTVEGKEFKRAAIVVRDGQLASTCPEIGPAGDQGLPSRIVEGTKAGPGRGVI